MRDNLLILIADDDRYHRTFTSTLLGKNGFDVIEAASGAEAFACIEESKPDLVLLDLCMPSQNGQTVLSKIRRSQETANIPVIIVTVDKSPMTFYQTNLLGIQDYVVKPFDPDELIIRINRVFAEFDADTMQKSDSKTLSDSAKNKLLKSDSNFKVRIS